MLYRAPCRGYATAAPRVTRIPSEVRSVWVIGDGISGNEMRSSALAEAIRKDFVVKRVESSRVISWLPILFQKFIVDLNFTKYGKKLFDASSPWYLNYPGKDKSITSPPLPDLVISCGDRTVIPSLHLRKQAKKTDFVHLGHPGIPFVSFNSVILQRHEIFKLAHLGPALSQQKGVIITQLALSPITPEVLKEYQSKAHKVLGEAFASKDPHSPVIGLFVGHLSPEFSFISQHAKKLADEAEPKFKDQLDPVVKRLQEEGFPVQYIPEDNQDAYRCALAAASYFVVPLGSVNLVSEAILTRKPVYIVGQEQSKGSLHIFGQRAISNGWARRFRVSPRYRPPGDPLSYIGEHPDFNPITTYPSMVQKAKSELMALLAEQKEDKA